MALDPNEAAVVTGLLANAITDLLKIGYSTVQRLGSERSSDPKRNHSAFLARLATNPAIGPLLQRTVTATVRDLELGKGEVDKLKPILASPEVVSIVKQIFTASLSPDRRTSSIDLLRRQFRQVLAVYTSLDKLRLDSFATDVFDAIVEGCVNTFNAAVERGLLSAHEALSAARHRHVSERLDAIDQALTTIAAITVTDAKKIQDFEKRYRREFEKKHSALVPPHLSGTSKVKIDALYVQASFIAPVTRSGVKRVKDGRLAATSLLEDLDRTVVLGNPGGGKSTFAQKMCHGLANSEVGSLVQGRFFTPIIVVLREYGAANKERHLSILRFIEQMIASTYQMEAPVGGIEFLLSQGHLAVVFDGLDELVDSGFRQKISEDVESFARHYPAVPILVTSRQVGYDQAPLDPEMFVTYQLAPFSPSQTSEYVHKWFALEAESTEKAEQKASAFLKESGATPDLRSNPLMLGLMCNIYREEKYIPRNRPEVYKKCAEMLFDRWDRRRDIPVSFRFDSEVRPAMAFLAHWIYSDERLQGGVTETQLIAKAADYLQKRYENRDLAEETAREFIGFCSGRAWVFTDTGTTATGESLYQFTHRTFLEYFAAVYLIRTHESADALSASLLPRIARSEWDVVCQLAYQIKHSESEDAADNLLRALLVACETSPEMDVLNMLSFASRALEFVAPSPSIVRRLTRRCAEKVIQVGVSALRKQGEGLGDQLELEEGAESEPTADGILGDLIVAGDEVKELIASELREVIRQTVESGGPEEEAIALDMGMNLSLAFTFSERQSGELASGEYWRAFEEEIHRMYSDRTKLLAKSYLIFALYRWFRDRDLMKEHLESHGIGILFRGAAHVAYPRVFMSAMGDIILHRAIIPAWAESADGRTNAIQQLESIGLLLEANPLPWMSSADLSEETNFGHSWMWRSNRPGEPELDWTPMTDLALIGVFALLAPALEGNTSASAKEQKIVPSLEKCPIAEVLKARSDPASVPRAQEIIGRLVIPPSITAVVGDWVTGKTSFVR